jgi:hypothetical protein
VPVGPEQAVDAARARREVLGEALPPAGWTALALERAGPVEQVQVGHAGRAGGLAAPAAEAGVEVGVAAGGRGELA